MSDGPITSDREFLESMAGTDEIIDHADGCGQCEHMRIMAAVARELLASGNIERAVSRWAELAEQQWRESKYFKLWQEEIAAGRDPHAEFARRGWGP